MMTLPNTNIVDFHSFEDTYGFGALVVSYTNTSGLIQGQVSRQAKEAVHTVQTAKQWIKAVKDEIDHYTAAETLRLMDIYDIIHRIAFSKPADSSFKENIILSALKELLRGDSRIDAYLLHRSIDMQIRIKNRAFFGKPLRWTSANIDSWYKKSKANLYQDISRYDIISQSGILFDTDLFAYEGRSDTFKQQLYTRQKFWLEEIPTMTPPELEAMSKFLNSSLRFMPIKEYWQYYLSLAEAAIAHPDTNPFYRQSIRLNLRHLLE